MVDRQSLSLGPWGHRHVPAGSGPPGSLRAGAGGATGGRPLPALRWGRGRGAPAPRGGGGTAGSGRGRTQPGESEAPAPLPRHPAIAAPGPAPPRASYRPLHPRPRAGPAGGCALRFCALIMAARGHVQDPNDRRLRPIYGTDPTDPRPRSPGPAGLPRPTRRRPETARRGPPQEPSSQPWPGRAARRAPAAGEPGQPSPGVRGSAAPSPAVPPGGGSQPPAAPSFLPRRPTEPRPGSRPPGAGSGSLAGSGGIRAPSPPGSGCFSLSFLPSAAGPGVSPLGNPPPVSGGGVGGIRARSRGLGWWGSNVLCLSVMVTSVGVCFLLQRSWKRINS